jgi:hypothetical protein
MSNRYHSAATASAMVPDLVLQQAGAAVKGMFSPQLAWCAWTLNARQSRDRNGLACAALNNCGSSRCVFTPLFMHRLR